MPLVDWRGLYAPKRLRRYSTDWTQDSKLRGGTPESADVEQSVIDGLAAWRLETGVEVIPEDQFPTPDLTVVAGEPAQTIPAAELANPITFRWPTLNFNGQSPGFVFVMETLEVDDQRSFFMSYNALAGGNNDAMLAQVSNNGVAGGTAVWGALAEQPPAIDVICTVRPPPGTITIYEGSTLRGAQLTGQAFAAGDHRIGMDLPSPFSPYGPGFDVRSSCLVYYDFEWNGGV